MANLPDQVMADPCEMFLGQEQELVFLQSPCSSWSMALQVAWWLLSAVHGIPCPAQWAG